MKKVILSFFLVLSIGLSFSSCSKDDETKTPVETKTDNDKDNDNDTDTDSDGYIKAEGNITFKLDGKSVELNNIIYLKYNNGNSYGVIARNSKLQQEYRLSFGVEIGVTGENIIYDLGYGTDTSDDIAYLDVDKTMKSTVSNNDKEQFKATFSGKLKSNRKDVYGNFTEGVINIKF